MRLAPLITLTLWTFALALVHAGCESTNAPSATKANYGDGVKVSGVITYRERIALPPDATVRARLVDITKPGAPVILSEQIIKKPGQVPVPFVLTIAGKKIDPNHNYAVDAAILVGRNERWKTTQQYGVITRGNPINGLMVWVQQVD